MEEPHIILYGGKEYIPKEYFDEYKRRSVSWDEADFEQKARDLEADAWDDDGNCTFDFQSDEPIPEQLQLYDRTKFTEALHEMMDNYDSEYGVDWDVIHGYLDKYCKL